MDIPPSNAAFPAASRSIATAILRGLKRRCPSCGVSPSLYGYLKVIKNCTHCGEALGHIRADDFPPYATILLLGHLMVPLILWVERNYVLPMSAQLAIWPLLTLVLALVMLPVVKGAILGLMWALRLRGDEHQ